MKQRRAVNLQDSAETLYWTTVIDQRNPAKYNADIYFRKALGVVTDWIKETAVVVVEPNSDPFKAVFG
jgi:hypothetical protein